MLWARCVEISHFVNVTRSYVLLISLRKKIPRFKYTCTLIRFPDHFGNGLEMKIDVCRVNVEWTLNWNSTRYATDNFTACTGSCTSSLSHIPLVFFIRKNWAPGTDSFTTEAAGTSRIVTKKLHSYNFWLWVQSCSPSIKALWTSCVLGLSRLSTVFQAWVASLALRLGSL